MYVCLSVHVEQLVSNWTEFHEIWHLRIFGISVEKIQFSLNYDKDNGYVS